MKKIYSITLVIAFIMVSCSQKNKSTATEQSEQSATTESAAPAQRYEIQSGCVVYNGPMGAIQTLYFDDYGAKEVFITEVDLGIAKSKEIQIRKDGYQYSYDPEKTQGTKMKWSTGGDVNYSKMDKELMARYKVKELGNENLAGKSCKKYSAEFGGSPIVTWVWHNIMVKTITSFGDKEMVIEATKIDEGPVDQALFEIPEGINFVEN